VIVLEKQLQVKENTEKQQIAYKHVFNRGKPEAIATPSGSETDERKKRHDCTTEKVFVYGEKLFFTGKQNTGRREAVFLEKQNAGYSKRTSL
jgi:hypothetical protein